MDAFVGKFELYLKDIMHIAAQALMIPVMIVLVGLIVYALYCVGSLIAEYFTERRYYKVHVPSVINAVHDAPFDGVVDVIRKTSFLNPQKDALIMVASNMGLPDDDLFALAKTQIAHLNARYQGVVGRNDLVTKVAPMCGLMATLIPLGPGIVAMGQGDVTTLSSSLLVAFDGTVAGLVGASVAMCSAKVRKTWYSQYASSVEALMTCILEKATEAREAGVELPHGYVGAPGADLVGARRGLKGLFGKGKKGAAVKAADVAKDADADKTDVLPVVGAADADAAKVAGDGASDATAEAAEAKDAKDSQTGKED